MVGSLTRRRSNLLALVVVLGLFASAFTGLVATDASAAAGPLLSGCDDHALEPNDDGSSDEINLPFPITIGGETFATMWVNNNGNVTFDESMSAYTPFGLSGTERAIIAPFFADVDTRGSSSDQVTYSWGTATYDGRQVVCVNWVNVGYYSAHDDKTNSFQLVLIDRSNVSPGDFDIMFNYERIDWETGDASDGENGFGGTSAAVGFSNGAEKWYEMPGTLEPGSFLDNGSYPLVSKSNADHPGRFVWKMRDGKSPTTYVALGDSYQSGEGARSYDSLTNQDGNRCHRSYSAYPWLLTDNPDFSYDLKFVACSGAKLWELTHPNQNQAGEPAQYNALGPDTALATLGISGNDLYFPDIIKTCVASGVSSFVNPLLRNVSCQNLIGRTVDGLLRSLRTGQLRDQVDEAYRQLRRDAPFAKVVVVTYPMFFNEPTDFWGVFGQLNWICHGVRGSDQFWINDKIQEADQILTSIARGRGFTVADVAGTFAYSQTGVCSSQPSMNGVTFPLVESFHPNASGQRLLADDIEIYVNSALAHTRTTAARTSGDDPSDTTEEVAVSAGAVETRSLEVDGTRLSVNTQWTDGDIDLELVDPDGRVYSATSHQGAEYESGATFRRLSVVAPSPGVWQVRVVGTRVLSDAELVTLSTFVESRRVARPVAKGKVQVAGNTVTFDASGSVSTTGGALRYRWDFGDGASSDDKVATHVYKVAGYYVPTLVVADIDDTAGFTTIPVVIDQPPSGTPGLVKLDLKNVEVKAKSPGAVRKVHVGGKPPAKHRTLTWKAPLARHKQARIAAYQITVRKKGSPGVVLARNVIMPGKLRLKIANHSLSGTGKFIVTVRAVNARGFGKRSSATFTVKR